MTASTEPPRRIGLKWPQLGVTVTAEMNDSLNPRLIDLLFERLPYRSLQNHALVAGDHLYHLVPSEKLIYTPAEFKVPNRTTEPDGTVFLSGLQHLSIKYGPLSEHFPAAPCGRVIPQDMKKLRRVGTGVWAACTKTKQVVEVVVWDASKPEPTERIPLQLERTGVSAEVKALIQKIHHETDNMWSGISFDMETVHSGLAPSRAGSKGSYFATMIFVNGEVRQLAYNVLNNILEIAATQPRFDLQHLVTLYKVFGSAPSEFLGYTGANFLWSTYREINVLIKENLRAGVDEQGAREDFLAMVSAFAKYVNLLNAQSLHAFPWKHIVEYPQQLG